MSYPQPDHCVRDSLEMRDVPHIEIDDGWRFVDGDLVGSSLQVPFEVEQIETAPSVGLEGWRVIRIVWVLLEACLLIPEFILKRIASRLVPSVVIETLDCLRNWCLDFKDEERIFMTLNVSHKVIDVVNDLREVRMCGVINLGELDQPWLEHSHSSVVDPVDNLDPLELFDQVKDVIEIDQETISRIIL